jgi:hypothetical protein
VPDVVPTPLAVAAVGTAAASRSLGMMSLSRTEALRMFNERYRSPELTIYTIGDTDVKGPERDPIFEWAPNAWYIRFSLDNAPMIRPSRLVCVSKADGRILFDGEARDEG